LLAVAIAVMARLAMRTASGGRAATLSAHWRAAVAATDAAREEKTRKRDEALKAKIESDKMARLYREQFQPSERLAKPYLLFGLNVVAAATDSEARRLSSSLEQAFLALRRGHPGPLPPPVDDMQSMLDAQARAVLKHTLSEAIVGSPTTVKARLADFALRTGADEIMVATSVFDHHARVHSFEIVAEAAASWLAPVGAPASTMA